MGQDYNTMLLALAKQTETNIQLKKNLLNLIQSLREYIEAEQEVYLCAKEELNTPFVNTNASEFDDVFKGTREEMQQYYQGKFKGNVYVLDYINTKNKIKENNIMKQPLHDVAKNLYETLTDDTTKYSSFQELVKKSCENEIYATYPESVDEMVCTLQCIHDRNQSLDDLIKELDNEPEEPKEHKPFLKQLVEEYSR